jgi:ATP-binding cassette subfamily B protein
MHKSDGMKIKVGKIMRDNTEKIEKDIVIEKKASISLIFRLFRYVFSSAKGICMLFLSATIVLSFLNPVLAFIWQKYIDNANAYGGSIFAVLQLILLILCYYVIRFILNLLWRYTNAFETIERLDIVQKNRMQEKLDTKLYSKISKLFPEYLEVPLINDVIDQTFSFSSDAMQRDIMIKGYTIISRLISVILIGLSLYVFSPMLCLVVIIAPIPSLYMSFIGSKIIHKFKKDNTSLLRKANYYQNLITTSATKEICSFNLFDYIYTKWKKLIDEYTKKEKILHLKICIIDSVNTLISNGTYIAGNILAIVLLTKGDITVGQLSAVLTLITFLINDTSSLLSSLGDFLSKKDECAKFFRLLDLKEQEYGELSSRKIENIDIRNLYYRYPMTDRYILNDVSIKIKKGEKIALVGENGAGKTTFVKLLTGMLSPSKGQIEINDQRMERINYKTWYNSISAVFQEPARYHTFSVSDNVKMGDILKNDDDMVITSLKKAGFSAADENTLLGKEIGGIDISGGEWQKLAIARCYYRNKDFMILDEPTGNLDPLAEAEIFKSYLKLSENRTVLIVTHRISIAALADRIIVFSDGKIVEDGSHENLISLNGVYANLYNAQAKWYNR